jgi:hypothetical protein
MALGPSELVSLLGLGLQSSSKLAITITNDTWERDSIKIGVIEFK